MDSPFQSVLHTNYAPTTDELSQIREFCKQPELDLEQLAGEITQLEDKLASLHAKRTKIRETLDAHRALLSPIKRLSPELLQYIFVWCLHGHRNPVMHASEAPLLLGRICSGWRQIVYETAELWAAVHVVIPSAHNAVQGSLRREAIKDWLNRSGECPLSISLYHDRDTHISESDSPTVTSSIMDVLISFRRRWSTFEMQTAVENAMQVCEAVSGDVPLLSCFRFSGGTRRFTGIPSPQSPHVDYLEKIIRFGVSQGGLRHLDLNIHMRRPNPSRLLPPLAPSSLQSVSLSFSGDMSTATSQILDLFSALPNLRQCTIRCSISSFSVNGAQQFPVLPLVLPSVERSPINLNNLQKLAMMVACPMHFVNGDQQSAAPLVQIFDNLVVPALTDMDFLLEFQTSQAFQTEFASFTNMLDRSSATLTRLAIRRSTECLLASLEHCVEQCPALKDLVLDRFNDSDGPTDDINPSEVVPPGDRMLNILMPLCPALQTLTLVHFPTSVLTHQTLGKFLNLRSQTLVPLARLWIRTQHWSSPLPTVMPMPPAFPTKELDQYPKEFDVELNDLRSKGMTITIEPEVRLRYSTSSSAWLGIRPPALDVDDVPI